MSRRAQAWLAGVLGVGALALFLVLMFDVGGFAGLLSLPVLDVLLVVLPPAMALAAIVIVVNLARSASPPSAPLASSPGQKDPAQAGESDGETTSANVAAVVGIVAAVVFFGCVALWILSWIVPTT